jgi:hypothetical protein
MAGGITNKGKARALNGFFRAQNVPTQFYLALATSATAPTADTNTFSELTEIAAGNGYTSGGQAVARNTTDFDTLTEDDANDRALTQLKDFARTASGGSLPASGSGARYAVLLDDNGTVGSREVLIWWDLVSDRSVSSGQTLTLQNGEARLSNS